MDITERQLAAFAAYCKVHPHLRFWQALACWAGVARVLVQPNGAPDTDTRDTWNSQRRDGQ